MFSTRSNSIANTQAHTLRTKQQQNIKLYDRIHTSNTHKPIYRIQFIENGFLKSLKNKYEMEYTEEEEEEEQNKRKLRRLHLGGIHFTVCIYENDRARALLKCYKIS